MSIFKITRFTIFIYQDHVCRTEGINLARDLDKRAAQAWVGHPYFDVVDNSSDFEAKVCRMIQVIIEGTKICDDDEGKGDMVDQEMRKMFGDVVVDKVFQDKSNKLATMSVSRSSSSSSSSSSGYCCSFENSTNIVSDDEALSSSNLSWSHSSSELSTLSLLDDSDYGGMTKSYSVTYSANTNNSYNDDDDST